MKYSWLEKLAEEGKISRGCLNDIYKDVDQLIKEAVSPERAAKLQEWGKLVGNLTLYAGVTGVVNHVLKGIDQKMEDSDVAKTIRQNKLNIMQMPEFAKNPEKTEARFNEIVSVAPHVAANQKLMENLLRHKMHSGLTDSDVQSLSMIQAQYMRQPYRTERVQKKLASIRPEVLGSILADVHLLKTAELIRPAVGVGQRIKNFASRVGHLVSAPLFIGAGAAATNSVLKKLDEIKLEKSLETSFRKAMALSSADKEPLHENPEKARQAFSALAHFAPHVALEPQAARAFMVKIVSYDQGVNTGDIKDLSEIQKNLSAVERRSPLIEGFVAGSNFVGAPGIAQNAFQDAGQNFMFEGKDEYRDKDSGKLYYKNPAPKGDKK
ncbi:MAG: hypothetical protein EBZ49_00385 [Proteobacteria bacterium]|nr:hypothetical protein [Pseudomonadota bacterium]